MRLIDADELHKELEKKGRPIGYNEYKLFYYLIDDAPTVDLWHYPSKGEYPPVGEFVATSHLVLVFWWNTDCNGKKAKVYGLDRWCEQHKEWDSYPQLPIAWQPLPEPPKEEGMKEDVLANKIFNEMLKKAYKQGYQDAIKDVEKKGNRRAE